MTKPVMKLLICMMLLSLACGTFARQIDTSLLIGTWGNSEDGGKTFWGYDKYLKDGTLVSWGAYPETDFSYKVRADYEVKVKFGTFSCLTITESSPITDFVGEFWCDEIIELTAETFTFKSSDGELTTLYRMP